MDEFSVDEGSVAECHSLLTGNIAEVAKSLGLFKEVKLGQGCRKP